MCRNIQLITQHTRWKQYLHIIGGWIVIQIYGFYYLHASFTCDITLYVVDIILLANENIHYDRFVNSRWIINHNNGHSGELNNQSLALYDNYAYNVFLVSTWRSLGAHIAGKLLI